MHFFQAFFLLISLSEHLTYPHATFKDVKLANYYIPKHSIVVVNLASVHQDPKLWDHPLVFRPERFLDEYGLLRQLDRFFPYGLGKLISFVYIQMVRAMGYFGAITFAHIFQKFRLRT